MTLLLWKRQNTYVSDENDAVQLMTVTRPEHNPKYYPPPPCLVFVFVIVVNWPRGYITAVVRCDRIFLIRRTHGRQIQERVVVYYVLKIILFYTNEKTATHRHSATGRATGNDSRQSFVSTADGGEKTKEVGAWTAHKGYGAANRPPANAYLFDVMTLRPAALDGRSDHYR